MERFAEEVITVDVPRATSRVVVDTQTVIIHPIGDGHAGSSGLITVEVPRWCWMLRDAPEARGDPEVATTR